jgi:type I restriction enzyme, S subunit
MKWNTDKLGNLTDIISGSTPNSEVKDYWGGEHIWITPTDLGKLQAIYIKSSDRKLTDAGLKNANLTRIPENSVVMSSRAPIGHLGITTTEIYTNQGCKSFVCGSKLDPHFLFYYLKYCLREIQFIGSGSTFAEVSKSMLEDFTISYPIELNDQKELAFKLNKQFSELKKAKEATLKTKQDLQAISKKQQQRALEILDELPRVPLSEYLESIEAGKSIQTTELIAKKDEVGVLKVSAVSWDRFQPNEAKSVIVGYNPPDAHRVKKGDLIISRANTLELVGAVVLVEDDYPNRLLSDKTLRLITKSEIIAEYLLYILKLPEARKHIEENATGTSNSMRNISQKTICTIPIPQADEDQQKAIIELMQLTRTELKKGETAIKLMLSDLNLLPNKLLQEAFNEIEND